MQLLSQLGRELLHFVGVIGVCGSSTQIPDAMNTILRICGPHDHRADCGGTVRASTSALQKETPHRRVGLVEWARTGERPTRGANVLGLSTHPS